MRAGRAGESGMVVAASSLSSSSFGTFVGIEASEQ